MSAGLIPPCTYQKTALRTQKALKRRGAQALSFQKMNLLIAQLFLIY